MIKLNLENAILETTIKKYDERVRKIHKGIETFELKGNELLGWKNLPTKQNKDEIKKINTVAKRLKKEGVELLVVIGIGGSCLGAKAGIDFVQGNLPAERDMEIMFVGESLSSTNLAQKIAYAHGKQFAINVVSKFGTTLEPAIAFRLFKKLLEEKLGVTNASKFIIATTDANNGSLLKQAIESRWTKFIIPDDICERFSVLTVVGLLPMACAGLKITKILDGAKIGEKKYGSDSKKNDAYKYGVARYVLGKKYPIEMLAVYEQQMMMTTKWWKHLFSESEGKNGKGIFPTTAVFSTDLHSVGQFLQEGTKNIFETIITVKNPTIDVVVISDSRNLDDLNYLKESTVHIINKKVFKGAVNAHTKVAKVPNIHIEVEQMDELHFGQLIYFFERACAMSAYLLGVNPFNHPGVGVYKTNMFELLGKPGYRKKE